MNPQTTILVSVVTAAGLHLAARVHTDRDSGESMRIIIGGFLLAATLLLLAEFWPDGAAGLAVVVMVTSLVMNGRNAFALLSSLVD